MLIVQEASIPYCSNLNNTEKKMRIDRTFFNLIYKDVHLYLHTYRTTIIAGMVLGLVSFGAKACLCGKIRKGLRSWDWETGPYY
jgi:hypothetical protein